MYRPGFNRGVFTGSPAAEPRNKRNEPYKVCEMKNIFQQFFNPTSNNPITPYRLLLLVWVCKTLSIASLKAARNLFNQSLWLVNISEIGF